jgi:hypothetical protein
MHQTQQDQPTRRPASSTDPLALLERSPLGAVLRHPELSWGAKGLASYVLAQPRGRLLTRLEFERAGLDVSPALDFALHELCRAGLLAPFPHGERPCCAEFFQLRED